MTSMFKPTYVPRQPIRGIISSVQSFSDHFLGRGNSMMLADQRSEVGAEIVVSEADVVPGLLPGLLIKVGSTYISTKRTGITSFYTTQPQSTSKVC
jgi:hypothetical protein